MLSTEGHIAKATVPGNSRLRDCERWLRENGFVVLEPDWDSDFVKKYLQSKIGPSGDIRRVKQSALAAHDYTHINVLFVDWKGVNVGPR